MFVLHPSSRCDVCLEAFSWEVEMAPYAIPCGHVFCKTCLDSVVPPKCPMCRKNFEPSRMKKLHVDRPEGEDDPREADLLQRVALAFDGTEELRIALMAEVDTYLQTREADTAKPLRKARRAMEKYREYKSMGIEGKRQVTILRREIREKDRVVEAEKERTTAIEMNLIDRARELQAQLELAKGEIEHLRAEIQRRTQLKNPLPAPPQPISLDRYAGFQATGSQAQWYSDHGRPMYLPAGTQPQRSVPTNGTPYHRPRAIFFDDERENQVLHDSNGTRRDRKGKGRDNHETTNDLYRSYGAQPPQAIQKPKTAGIIPGASPKSKFIPPDPEIEERDRGIEAFAPEHPPGIQRSYDSPDAYATLNLAIPEYTNGYAEGYTNVVHVVQRAMPSGSRAEPEASASESDRERRERRAKRRQEREEKRERHRERERRREHEREREQEDQGGQSTAAQRANRHEGSSNSTEAQRARTRHRLREGTDALTVDQPSTSSDRRPSTSRPQSGSYQAPPPPPVPVVTEIAQPTPQVPAQIHQETIENLDHTAEVMLTPASRRSVQTNGTVESWGTVSTAPPISPNSFTSLNLRGLPTPIIPLEGPSFDSPPRPAPIVIAPPDEGSSPDEETETDEVVPTPIALSHPSSNTRHYQGRSQTAGPVPTEQQWGSHPLSAPPIHPPGTRHTQTLTIPVTDHYQNPTLPQHPPPSAIRSASAAVPEPGSSRQHASRGSNSSGHRSRRDTQHRSRHSASQVPVIPGETGRNTTSSNARARRVSFTAAPPANINASTSSLSLLPPGGHPHSAAEELEAMHDAGYHTDVPSSENALGLAISAADREYAVGNHAGPGFLVISHPRPVVPKTAFLRSFSHDTAT